MLSLTFGLMLIASVSTTGCRMAPKDEPGDTVAAYVFAPVDTAALNRKAREAAAKKAAMVKDSTDIFYVGDGSTKEMLQLVSYPSRRDTMEYGKTGHCKKKGNADYGHVVRIQLWVSERGDTLVKSIEEIVEDNKEENGG